MFLLALLFMPMAYGASNCASSDLSLILDEFMSIKTISSPVLVANITDRTGNLYAPLSSKFRVISNCSSPQTLYLKADALTENGIEPAMFSVGDMVYVAFANMNIPPKSEALVNCKMLTDPQYSPGVVAYPVMSVFGAKNEYMTGEGKYKVIIENGTTDITVNIGSHVLKNSFDSNDPMGFYQATLSLTESEI
jgi:hypothetical protein